MKKKIPTNFCEKKIRKIFEKKKFLLEKRKNEEQVFQNLGKVNFFNFSESIAN